MRTKDKIKVENREKWRNVEKRREKRNNEEKIRGKK